MTNQERKHRKVVELFYQVTDAQSQVANRQQQLADASAHQIKTIKLGREALFDLYVSSSHRWFMKFLKENS